MNKADNLKKIAVDVHKDIDKKTDRKKIGERIKKYRKQYTSFTQSDMAEMTNLSVVNYARYEQGCSGFGLEILLVISGILGMPIELMLSDDASERLISVNKDEMDMIKEYRLSSSKRQEAILFMLTRDKQ